jgi:hypothetical protein
MLFSFDDPDLIFQYLMYAFRAHLSFLAVFRGNTRVFHFQPSTAPLAGEATSC